MPAPDAMQIVTPQLFVENDPDEDDPIISFVDMDSNRPFSFYLESMEEVPDRPGNVILTSTSDDRFLVSPNLTEAQREAVEDRKRGLWG